MPIIMPSDYEPTDRDQEIWLVMNEIASAHQGSRDIALF